jgi:hypothetical protein
MQRITGLVEVEGRKRQQVQSRLDQLGMTDHHLNAGLQLPLVPVLSFIGGD